MRFFFKDKSLLFLLLLIVGLGLVRGQDEAEASGEAEVVEETPEEEATAPAEGNERQTDVDHLRDNNGSHRLIHFLCFFGLINDS
jgi:hypothetical protein